MKFLKKANKGVIMFIVIAVVLVFMIVIEALGAMPDEKAIREKLSEVQAIEEEYIMHEPFANAEEETAFFSDIAEKLKPYYATELIVENSELVTRATDDLWAFMAGYNSANVAFKELKPHGKNYISVSFNAEKTEAKATLKMDAEYDYKDSKFAYFSSQLTFIVQFVKEKDGWKIVSPVYGNDTSYIDLF